MSAIERYSPVPEYIDVLDQISEYLRTSLNRPLCVQCCLARTQEQPCDWCREQSKRRGEKLQQFLEQRKGEPWTTHSRSQ